MNRRSLLKRCLLAPMAVLFGFSVEPDITELEAEQVTTWCVSTWAPEMNTNIHDIPITFFTSQPPSRARNAEKVGL